MCTAGVVSLCGNIRVWGDNRRLGFVLLLLLIRTTIFVQPQCLLVLAWEAAAVGHCWLDYLLLITTLLHTLLRQNTITDASVSDTSYVHLSKKCHPTQFLARVRVSDGFTQKQLHHPPRQLETDWVLQPILKTTNIGLWTQNSGLVFFFLCPISVWLLSVGFICFTDLFVFLMLFCCGVGIVIFHVLSCVVQLFVTHHVVISQLR